MGFSKFALLAVGVVAHAPHGLSTPFLTWASEHEKSYHSTAAWKAAEATFFENEKIISELNSNPDDNAEYGHTKFSDMSAKDFVDTILSRPMSQAEGRAGGIDAEEVTAPAPASADWRTKGAISPVKNQGPCGSCWAVSAVENIETMNFIANPSKPVMNLSVEQIIECDEYAYACYGGFPAKAFKYVVEAGGIATEADYPYTVSGKTICLANQTFNKTCGDGMCDDPPLTSYCDVTCSAKKHKKAVQIKGFNNLPTDEVKLAAWVAQNGAPSVALDASGNGPLAILFPWMQFYKKGVANPKHCSTTHLDHAVHIVGYGTDSGSDYWIVKNSWGATWGEEGFFRIARGTGKCGINTIPTSAIAEKTVLTAIEELVV